MVDAYDLLSAFLDQTVLNDDVKSCRPVNFTDSNDKLFHESSSSPWQQRPAEGGAFPCKGARHCPGFFLRIVLHRVARAGGGSVRPAIGVPGPGQPSTGLASKTLMT